MLFGQISARADILKLSVLGDNRRIGLDVPICAQFDGAEPRIRNNHLTFCRLRTIMGAGKTKARAFTGNTVFATGFRTSSSFLLLGLTGSISPSRTARGVVPHLVVYATLQFEACRAVS